jgi:hypothetical protein
VTLSALIRDILIIYDSKGYFEKAWKHHYTTLEYHSEGVFQAFQVDMSNFPFEDIEFAQP